MGCRSEWVTIWASLLWLAHVQVQATATNLDAIPIVNARAIAMALIAGRQPESIQDRPHAPDRPPMPIPSPAAISPPWTIRVEVPLVQLLISVRDRSGAAVTGLKVEDFQVFENNRLQPIVAFESEVTPLHLVVLVDCSGSTRHGRQALLNATRRLLEALSPGHHVALYALAESQLVMLHRTSLDRQLIAQALERLPEPGGGTPLYDAIVLTYAQESPWLKLHRSALIVLTDGVDDRIRGGIRPSETEPRLLVRLARQYAAVVYVLQINPFTLVPEPAWMTRARRALEKVAVATGGQLFRAESWDVIERLYPELNRELAALYTIAYRPSIPLGDGRWRQIRVRINRPGLIVRHRAGYYAW